MATLESEYPVYYLDGSDYGNLSILSNLSMRDQESRPIKPEEAIAIALCTITIIFNVLALLAIINVKGRLSTNLRLITSLTLSDILVGVSYMLKITNGTLNPFFLSVTVFSQCLEHITHALITSAYLVVLLNLLGLAVDHYCAICKPLGYPVLMSHKRVNFMIFAFWGVAFFVGFSRFIMPVEIYYHCEQYREYTSYCEYIECSKYDPEYTMYCIVLVAFLTMAYLYTCICCKIRAYQSMQGRHSRYMKRNTRGLLTTFFIVITFALLWIPYCIFSLYIHLSLIRFPYNLLTYMSLQKDAMFYLYDLVLLNSMCDSIIYAVRMREVRHGFRRFLMRFTKEGRLRLSRPSMRERQTSHMSSGALASLKRESHPDANQNHSEIQMEDCH